LKKTAAELEYLSSDYIFCPKLVSDASKKASVDIKESNYFNAIQSIAATFKCWPKFEVNHNPETGEITNFEGQTYSKRIYFKNYVG
jgi:hypothetical protein